MKKIGIIKAISRKDGGKNAFTLRGEQQNGKDVWFNGYSLDAEKGDEVEFDLEINGEFNNFSNLRVITKASVSENSDGCSGDFRLNIDAGNCVQRATELVIAGKFETLRAATEAVCGAFREAQRQLNDKIKE